MQPKATDTTEEDPQGLLGIPQQKPAQQAWKGPPGVGPQPGMRPGAMAPTGFAGPRAYSPRDNVVRPGGSGQFDRRLPDLNPSSAAQNGMAYRAAHGLDPLQQQQRRFVQGSKLSPRGAAQMQPSQPTLGPGATVPMPGLPILHGGAETLPGTMHPQGRAETLQAAPASVVATPTGMKWVGADGAHYDYVDHPVTGEAIPSSDGCTPEQFSASLTPQARAGLMEIVQDKGGAAGKRIAEIEQVRQRIANAQTMRPAEREREDARLRQEQDRLLWGMAQQRNLAPAIRSVAQDHEREMRDFEARNKNDIAAASRLEEQQRKARQQQWERARKESERTLRAHYGPYRSPTPAEIDALAAQSIMSQGGEVPQDMAQPDEQQAAPEQASVHPDDPLEYGPDGQTAVDPDGNEVEAAVFQGQHVAVVRSPQQAWQLPPGTNYVMPGEGDAMKVHVVPGAEGKPAGNPDLEMAGARDDAQKIAQKRVEEHGKWKKEQRSLGAFRSGVMQRITDDAVAQAGVKKWVDDTAFSRGLDGTWQPDSEKTAQVHEARRKAVLDALREDKAAARTEWGRRALETGMVPSAIQPPESIRPQFERHSAEQDRLATEADMRARAAAQAAAGTVASKAADLAAKIDADPYQQNLPADEALRRRDEIMAAIAQAKKAGGVRFAGTHGDATKTLGAAQRIADMAVDPTVAPGAYLFLGDRDGIALEDFKAGQDKVLDAAVEAARKAGIPKAVSDVVDALKAGKKLMGDSPEVASARRAVLASKDPALLRAWREVTTKTSTVPDGASLAFRKALASTGADLATGEHARAEYDPSQPDPADVEAARRERAAKRGTTPEKEQAEQLSRSIRGVAWRAGARATLPDGTDVPVARVEGRRFPVATDAASAWALVRAGIPQATVKDGRPAAVRITAQDIPAGGVPQVGEWVDASFPHLPRQQRDEFIKAIVSARR